MANSAVQRTVLANGTVLLTEAIPHVRSVSIGVWIKTGSRHEEYSALSGVSHFIEHLAFKGTPQRSAREIAFTIDSLGGHLDAFTGREYTCFYTRVMDKHLPQAVELLADIVLHPSLDPKEMEVERQVILEEIRTTEDSPDDYVHDLFIQAVWRGHTLGQSILGTSKSISNLSHQGLVTYFKQNYYGGNMIISAAGNLEHRELRELIEKYFQGDNKPPATTPPAQTNTPRFQQHLTSRGKDLEQVHLCLGCKGIPYDNEQRFPAYLLNTLLGAGMSSRLFQKIREERGLAYVIYSYFSAYRDVGFFAVYAGTAPHRVQEVIELIAQEFKTIKNTPVGEVELRKVKEHLKGSLMLGLESTTNRMTTLAKYQIYFGRHFTLDEILAGIESVTPEQIQELAQDIFQSETLSLALLGPAKAISLDKGVLRC